MILYDSNSGSCISMPFDRKTANRRPHFGWHAGRSLLTSDVLTYPNILMQPTEHPVHVRKAVKAPLVLFYMHAVKTAFRECRSPCMEWHKYLEYTVTQSTAECALNIRAVLPISSLIPRARRIPRWMRVNCVLLPLIGIACWLLFDW
mmetsp:Transcript_13922/g.38257  ORF Transcript_13922/g.38257 Transcript_13922/m.38257 type:complete len:147 (-) Transcript_13922:237-677(-)